MIIEIIITIIIICLSIYFIYSNIKKSISGKCNCENCMADCPLNKGSK